MTTVSKISDLQALAQFGSMCHAQRGDMLCREGDRNAHVIFLASGFVTAVKHTVGGQQQNVALFVPGDIVNHESYSLGRSRSGAVAMTDVVYHRVAHAGLDELFETGVVERRTFWRHVAFHGSLAQEWLLNLGQRSAFSRTAHLLCEIISRIGVPGECHQITCRMPMTQTEVADTLGLSVVHVNRTLTRLRQEGLIRLRRGEIDVLDWPRLKTTAGFDPSYLHAGG